MSISLDPDQARPFVGPDLGPNCLPRLSADDTGKQRGNPLEANGLSHPYHLDESIFIFRGLRGNFSFLFHFSIKIILAMRIAPDGTPHFAASRPGLFCVPMSHKKDTGLIWVKVRTYISIERFAIKFQSKSTRCLKMRKVSGRRPFIKKAGLQLPNILNNTST